MDIKMHITIGILSLRQEKISVFLAELTGVTKKKKKLSLSNSFWAEFAIEPMSF